MFAPLRHILRAQLVRCSCIALFIAGPLLSLPENSAASVTAAGTRQIEKESSSAGIAAGEMQNAAPSNLQTTDDWNRRLNELANSDPSSPGRGEYRIGPEDVLDINVFEAKELNCEVRVSASGDVSLPLVGTVRAAGFTPEQLGFVLQQILQRDYMKHPHVSVFVREMQSHPVSVVGAVKQPGVLQIRGSKSLLEVLALSGGLADDAGETVIIQRGASISADTDPSAAPRDVNQPSSGGPRASEENAVLSTPGDDPPAAGTAIQVNLKDLLESPDPDVDPMVFPGDIVKVTRAGIVYVIGEVRRPGGFALKSNETISVLQALALSEGLTATASKSGARIIRTDPHNGERSKIRLDLKKILAGKAPDPMLEASDILFVPNSAAKIALTRGVEAGAQTLTGLLIFHW